MGGSHRRPWRYLTILMAAAGLALAGAPAHAAPPIPQEPPPAPAPLDPLAAVAQVGPGIVDINTEMGFAGAVGAGTGIVLDPNGLVLTNNHVVNGSTRTTAVAIANNQPYDVDVLGYDRNHDIAVVQLVGAAGLPPATIGDSSTVKVGEPVIAVGNAGGQGGTPNAVNGKVIALNQTVTAADELSGHSETLDGLIQSDTPIRAGDSGGPLVNAAGQVIGVNTAASGNFRLPTQGGEGYAIPINQALGIADRIRSGSNSGGVHVGPTAFFGVGVVDNNNGAGAQVVRVLEDTPAAEAGIAENDVIVAVDNAPVTSATSLTDVMDTHHPGDVVEVRWRGPFGAGEQAAKVTLAPGPVG
jgi:S1-C subfamily serine protease